MKIILISLILISLTFCDYALSETEASLDMGIVEINDSWMEYNTLTIQTGPEEVLEIEYDTGDIYYRGKLIETDKELVNAFKHLFENFTCPHCGRSMYEFEGE